MIEDVLARFSDVPLEEFIILLQEHEFLASILIQFFGGDLAIHMFGVLNGSGKISLTPIMASIIVILLFDILIYCIIQALQQSNAVLKHFRKVQFFKRIEMFFKRNEQRYRKSPTVLLIAIKLMPLSKITFLFFALSQKMSITKFIVRDSIISIVWVIILFIPGWFVGKGLLTQEAGIQTSNFILYFALVILAVVLFGKKIDQILMWGMDQIANRFDKNENVV